MEQPERSAFSSSVAGKAVRATFDGGRLTSDVLVLAEIERRLGIAERLARCLTDPRSPERVRHTVAEMIRFRVPPIAAALRLAAGIAGPWLLARHRDGRRWRQRPGAGRAYPDSPR
jgi:DDE family transposase